MRVTNMAVSLERRRGEVERGRFAQGGDFKVSYRIACVGAGELSVDVNFPVWFQDIPALSHGGEMVAGTALDPGNFPWVSAVGGGWKTQERSGLTYYTGTLVIVVFGGTTIQRGWAHFHAEGRALQGPVD